MKLFIYKFICLFPLESKLQEDKSFSSLLFISVQESPG